MTTKSRNRVKILTPDTWNRIQRSLNGGKTYMESFKKRDLNASIQRDQLEEMEVKKQDRAKQLEQLQLKLIQQHPSVRMFKQKFDADCIMKVNEELISNREKMNQLQLESVSKEEEELSISAKIQKRAEDEDQRRRLVGQALNEENVQVLKEKKRLEEGRRRRRREERGALKDKKDTQNHREEMADLTFIQVDADMKYDQERENEQEMSCFQNQQNMKTVSDQLAAIKKEQEATKRLLEERAFKKAVAEREAKEAKRLKDEMEKKAELRKSYPKFLDKQIQVKLLKRRAEKQAAYQTRQSLFEADRMYEIEKKQQLQKKREICMSFCEANCALSREKREEKLMMKEEPKEPKWQSFHHPEVRAEVLNKYLASQLTRAEELGLNVDRLTKIGNDAMVLLDEQPEVFYRNIPLPPPPPVLPRLETCRTRRAKLIPSRDGIDALLPNKTLPVVPPLKKCSAVDLRSDDDGKFTKPVGSKLVLPPIRMN